MKNPIKYLYVKLRLRKYRKENNKFLDKLVSAVYDINPKKVKELLNSKPDVDYLNLMTPTILDNAITQKKEKEGSLRGDEYTKQQKGVVKKAEKGKKMIEESGLDVPMKNIGDEDIKKALREGVEMKVKKGLESYNEIIDLLESREVKKSDDITTEKLYNLISAKEEKDMKRAEKDYDNLKRNIKDYYQKNKEYLKLSFVAASLSVVGAIAATKINQNGSDNIVVEEGSDETVEVPQDESPAAAIAAKIVEATLEAIEKPEAKPKPKAEAEANQNSENDIQSIPENKIWVVEKGDTVSDIARKNDLSVKEIKEANPELNPDKIKAGDEIILPILRHEVEKGDIVSDMAERYGTSVKKIKEANPWLEDENKIKPGDEIIIPVLIYKVEEGNTLYSIAKLYGTSVKGIEDVNPGLDPDKIKEGQKIIIPIDRAKTGKELKNEVSFNNVGYPCSGCNEIYTKG